MDKDGPYFGGNFIFIKIFFVKTGKDLSLVDIHIFPFLHRF